MFVGKLSILTAMAVTMQSENHVVGSLSFTPHCPLISSFFKFSHYQLLDPGTERRIHRRLSVGICLNKWRGFEEEEAVFVAYNDK